MRFGNYGAAADFEEKARSVFRKALRHWMNAIADALTPTAALFQTKFAYNPFLMWLFRECANVPDEEGETGPRYPPTVFSADLHEVKAALPAGQPISWLWRHHDPEGSPRIMVRRDYLDEFYRTMKPAARRRQWIQMKTNRIVLHEIGHVALHWRELAHRSPPNSPLPPSTPQDEEEAWQFCAFILGMALGQHAFDVRQKGHDDTWLLV